MEANHDSQDDEPRVVMLRAGEVETPVLNPCDACPTLELVQTLRGLLRDSLLQPQQDLHQACAVIAADPGVTVERVSAAFFHGLSRYAKRRMVFFNTRASGVSAGERWVARLLEVVAQDDTASARYLIESTIDPAGQRWMLFLARQLASHLMPPASDKRPSSVDCQSNSKEIEK